LGARSTLSVVPSSPAAGKNGLNAAPSTAFASASRAAADADEAGAGAVPLEPELVGPGAAGPEAVEPLGEGPEPPLSHAGKRSTKARKAAAARIERESFRALWACQRRSRP
jgi:hypothetical protein